MSEAAGARETVLARIRTALGVEACDRWRVAAVRDRIERHPRGTIPARCKLNRRACADLFGTMLKAQGADFALAAEPEDIVRSIAAYLTERELPTSLRISEEPVLAALPWTLAPEINWQYGVAAPADGVGLSRAIVGAAETGTLFVVSGEGNPTSLNFLPGTHIVLLAAEDIVPAYEDAWDRLRALYGEGTLPRSVNWISGPSRTADIEQTIVRGAHGPQRLFVVISG
jgi:L-lactate dehydrogenase complex protein LldG